MSELQYLDVTYQTWKNARDFFGGASNSYYISHAEEGYTLVLINFNLNRSFVVSCRLNIGNSDRLVNISDFETNLKNISISQNSMDDCVVAALIGA